MFSLFPTAEVILLVTALSMDAFASSFAYGASKIKVPLLSSAVVSVVCGAILALSLSLGTLVRPFIPANAAGTACFIILFFLGVSKIFDSTTKALIKKYNRIDKELKFKLSRFNFILNVYVNPEAADIDHSRVLSPAEAAYLAVALSIDGLAVGFGTGLTEAGYIQIVLFSLVSNMLAVVLGCCAGNKISEKVTLNLEWLGGAILLALAFTKL